jgi:hypothetical protein
MGWIDTAHRYEKKEIAQRLCQLFDPAETTTSLFRSTTERMGRELSDWLRHLSDGSLGPGISGGMRRNWDIDIAVFILTFPRHWY